MQNEIARMVLDFEHGRLSRRQLIAHLAGIIALTAGARTVFGKPGANWMRSGAAIGPISCRTQLRSSVFSVSDAGSPFISVT